MTDLPKEPSRPSAADLGGAQPLYEHARWMFERDEQRSADFVARAGSLMSVAAAVAALLPVGYTLVSDRLSGSLDSVTVTLLAGAELAMLVALGIGVAVVASGQASVAPRQHLLDRWDAWKSATAAGKRPLAASTLYRDFAGALMDTQEGREHAPLVTQRRLTDRRAQLFNAQAVLFIVGLLLLGVASMVVLTGGVTDA